MQGYIININKVKDEDLIVTVLTEDSVLTMYRFYGARHSTINLGYKIDFEVQSSIKSTIPQLRGVLHLGSKWTMQRERMYIWQSFIQLFYKHLKDIDEIHSFYFNLLEECNHKWHTQNPKRISIESYVRLLEFEGRLNDEFICFNCEEVIEQNPSLIRGFLLAHENCVWSEPFERSYIEDLFEHKSTLFFNDEEVDKLWKILMEGF